MAFQYDYLKNKALEAIKEHKLFFLVDVIVYMPCCKDTFYDRKLNEDPDVMAAIERNKVELKVSLRHKWYKSDAPVTQIVLYKLLATDEELSRISNRPQEEKPSSVTIKIVEDEDSKESDEE